MVLIGQMVPTAGARGGAAGGDAVGAVAGQVQQGALVGPLMVMVMLVYFGALEIRRNIQMTLIIATYGFETSNKAWIQLWDQYQSQI